MKERIGTIVWGELQTPYIDEMKNLWSQLFGYHWEELPLDDKIKYHIASLEGRNACGVAPLPAALRKIGGSAFHLYFFAVEDLEKSVERALSLGAKVIVKEIALTSLGKWSILTDPLGGVFCMVEMKAEPISLGENKQGSYWWHELICKEPAKSAFFYGRLFDWKVAEQKISEEETHYLAENMQGELLRMSFRPMDSVLKEAGVPDFWLGFLSVDDIDEICNKAVSLGGTILSETPKNVEGRYAWLALPDKSLMGFIEIS